MSYEYRFFPRNPDGTLKHQRPCQTPGCDWPNWHICLDKTDPAHTKVHERRPKRVGRKMTESQKQMISESQRQRHATLRARSQGRDDQIIKYYTEEELGMSRIAERMGIAQATVSKVLHRAQDEGVLKLRPKHYTLARPRR